MSAQEMTADSDLLEAYARRRSADAFAELVRRYAALVYSIGLRITRNREDAQDIAQECFLQLAAQAAQVIQPLPAWLHTLARSRAIDLIRRRGARQRHELGAVRLDSSILSLDEWEMLSRHVDEAIEKLPDDLRVCLIGTYLQGRTQQELAQELGIAQGTISRRVEKAIEQLRELLRQAGVDVPAASVAAGLEEIGRDKSMPASLPPTLARIGLSGVGAAATRTGSGLLVVGAGLVLVAVAAGVGYWAIHLRGSATSVPATGAASMAATQSAPQMTGRIVRQGGKVWIEGVSPGDPNTNPYCQGLAILLQSIGRQDATYARVMGYSGVAFALQMDLSGPIRDGKYDVAWWPNDSYVFKMRAEFVGRAFGRELRRVSCDGAAAGADARQKYMTSLESAVTAAIEQGLPVLGQQDSAVLVSGYDTASRMPILVWPSPGQPAFGPSDNGIPWGVFVPGKLVEAMPQDEAELESLKWAVALWDETAATTAKDWDASKILTGSKAFATWLELLQEQKDGVGLGRDSWDNNMMIHLRYNQSAAIAYLRELAVGHPAVADDLDAAADLYQQAKDECDRAPFWGRTSPERRSEGLQQYTDIVRRTMQVEGLAVERIRQAIAAWPKAAVLPTSRHWR